MMARALEVGVLFVIPVFCFIEVFFFSLYLYEKDLLLVSSCDPVVRYYL